MTQQIKLPEGWIFDKVENGTIFLKETLKLPTSWEECPKEYAYVKTNYKFSYKNSESLVTLDKLLILRDVYNDGWTPNYVEKYWYFCIDPQNNIYIYMGVHSPGISRKLFAFKTRELCETFVNNFRSYILELLPMFSYGSL